MLYPPRCAGCDEILRIGENGICKECEQKLRYIGDEHCMKCGRPLLDNAKVLCRDCKAKTHYFDMARAVFEYKDMARSLYRFKYQGRQEYAGFYASQIEKHLGELICQWKPDVIIPVPIHKIRRRKRGYNQAELLARRVGERMQIPVDEKLVKRCKNTKPLRLQRALERQKSLDRAFIISRNDVKLKTTILFDDIYTTGSTVDAISKVLREHGVEKIYVITVAIGKT